MENSQRSILIGLAFFVIGSGVLLLTLFSIAAPLHGIQSESALGSSFYRILEDFRSLQAVFGPVGVVLVAGLAAAAGRSAAPGYFKVMSLLLMLGLIATLALLYFVVFDREVGSFISRNSPWDIEPREFRNLAYPFLGWSFGAVVGGLGALLGISKLGAAPK
jgi:hypothetical protein